MDNHSDTYHSPVFSKHEKPGSDPGVSMPHHIPDSFQMLIPISLYKKNQPLGIKIGWSGCQSTAVDRVLTTGFIRPTTFHVRAMKHDTVHTETIKG